MLVIPAIDIKDGKCVRLRQGRMSEETVFSAFPEQMALKWFDLGAEKIHVVDLNGAIKGLPVNSKVIKKIVETVPIPIELGGGIRDLDTLDAYMDLGVQEIILGTVALKDPDLFWEACEKYPGRIILAIDAKQGHVAIEGWTESVGLSPVDMAKKFQHPGISGIIYTDISRDGMRTGPNVDAAAELAKSVDVPLIVAGGISDITHVMEILELEPLGVTGMITGRAIYDGSLDLEEAIRLCKKDKKKKDFS